MSDRAPTSDELRARIDRSQTGDKVAYPDPAAAPLGGDDEAAGRPPSAKERALASLMETNRVREQPGPGRAGRFGFLTTAAIAAVVFVALVVLLVSVR